MTTKDFLITAAIGLSASFLGSFLCFVIWIHFHLEQHWHARHKRLEANRWKRSEEGQREMRQYRNERNDPDRVGQDAIDAGWYER